jgi:hypothetical protein
MEINKGSQYYLEILVTDQLGDAVTGLTVTYKVIKSSDNSLVDSGTLTDVGDGIYQDSYVFNNLGQYRIVYFTPTHYSNEVETIVVVDENIMTIVQKILGFSGNYRIFDPSYDGRNNLLYCIIKVYANGTDCENDVNPLATYQVDATYDSKNRMTGYKAKEL